jgi:hypothetical protein
VTDKRLDLVFLWHMHQPDYRDHTSDEHVLPWVYLHAIKDYTDMADHLERHPGIRAVVNFVPVLLDQIEDYCGQVESGVYRDPLLRLLAAPDLSQISPSDRSLLLEACFRSNHVTMLSPFPRYQRLHDLYNSLAREGENALAYLSGDYFGDLVTWYHLAWTSETERRHRLIAELMSKGESYCHGERLALRTDRQRPAHLVPVTAHCRNVARSNSRRRPPPIRWRRCCSTRRRPAKPARCRACPGGRAIPRPPAVVAQIEAAKTSHAARFGTTPMRHVAGRGRDSTGVVQHLAAQGCGTGWPAAGACCATACGSAAAPATRAPPTGPGKCRKRPASRCSFATSGFRT